MRKLGLPATLLAAALVGCGAGSNVVYYRVLAAESSVPSGNNCPACTVNGCTNSTYSGIDGVGTWAIYTAPAGSGGGSQYLLDDGSGNLIVGTLASGAYSFTATYTNVTGGSNSYTRTDQTLYQLTLSGDGFTGSVTSNTDCAGSSCPGGQGPGGWTCGSSFPVTGVVINAVNHKTDVSPAAPSAPSPTSGQGNGNGGNNGGNGGTCATSACTSASQCSPCTCPTDGKTGGMRECAGNCCVDSCPTSGFASTGSNCVSDCDCTSGICNNGTCL